MPSAAFLLLILGAPLPASDIDQNYYPVQVGTQWTYKLGNTNDKFVITVLKPVTVGQQDCFVFDAKLNGKDAATEHVAWLKDGVHRFMYGDKPFEPPICFFKPGAKKGDTWKQDYKIGDAKGSIKFLVDVEDVEVPAGKFKDALAVHAEATENNTVSKTTIWYVKNGGMVKQLIEDEKPIVLELEKMSLPTK